MRDLTDESLCAAVREMEQGLTDANLGGNLYKKRVPVAGRGKRGGARTLIATNMHDRWSFVFGFQKNERENISQKELEALKEIAGELLKRSSKELTLLVGTKALEEICHDHEN